MAKRSFWGLFVVLCLVFSLCSRTASGQAVYGSIFGTVVDAQGSAVSGAKVTVTSLTKGTTQETTTNESGNYSVTHLIPDAYSVKAEASGFKNYAVARVEVSADSAVKVDAALEVGNVSETVEVTAEVPQLKTDRADVSMEFNQRYIEDLPILNRNFTTFELLSPGTQKLGWSHAATENPQGAQQIMVNGQHFSGTAFELDGTDNQDPILGIIVINPNLDAIQEAKITLQNYDAEFGKAVAGVVTVQTKSGTNEIHGSAFWDRYTDATQARDPFTNSKVDALTGRFLPSTKWNSFGGTLGGPVLKDKLFIFGDYQGTRKTTGISNLITIPTSRVLSTCGGTGPFCDLSEYQPKIGNGKLGDPSNYIFDPASSTAADGSGRRAFCGASGLVLNPTPATCPTPFLIPRNRLSPQALAILKLFPAPNNGAAGAVKDNFVGSGSGPFVGNAFDTRVDYNISQSLTMFGRFSLNYFSLSGKGSLGVLGGPGTGPIGLNGSSIVHNYSLATGVTKSFSPTLVADFRFGWFKYNPQTKKSDQGSNIASAAISAGGFGIPNLNLGDVFTSGLPAFNMDGVISNFGDGLNVGRCNCPLTESEQQFQGVTNWTKMKGNHQLKFGADIRYAMNLRVPSDANRTGEPVFNTGGTGNAGSGGLDLATFLLGYVTQMDRYVSNGASALTAAERQKRYFFYGQDVFRVTSKLTINYGLRWEFYTPESVNGKGQGGFANLQDGFIHIAGYGKFSNAGDVDNNWKLLAPRIGVAYQITKSTVVRVGYGRSYDMGVFGSNFGHSVTQNLPVLARQHVDATNSDVNGGNGSAANAVGRIPAFTLAQGPPLFKFPAIPANGLLPLEGPGNDASTHIRPTFQRLPTLDAWNATVQHQLTQTLSVEVAYIGNKGSHAFAGNGPAYNVNQFPVSPGRSIDGKFRPFNSQNARRPLFNKYIYQNYPDPNNASQPLRCCSTDVGNYYGNDASTSYNALQIKAEKRFTHGLQFLAHYTFSRSYNYNYDNYANDPRVAWGPDDTNRNHVFIANVVYELPFGKGKAFMSSGGRAQDLIFGGWMLSSTTNWSGGTAFTPSYGECGQDQDANVCRPDVGTGSFKLGAQRDPATGTFTWFTPIPALAISAPPGTDFCRVARPSGNGFARPACGTIGNFPRDSLRGPHVFTTDMSLSKSFGITERVRGGFRVDAFNVFNHVVLGNPGNTCIDCNGIAQGGDAGKISDINNNTTMRQLQFGLKFTF